MKISLAEIRHVAMPLLRPWRTAYGEDAAIHSILVRLSCDGVDGWGESCPLYAPTYSPESALTVYQTCREFLLPRIVGREIDTAAELMKCHSIYRGNSFSKAAVETAWWALDSQLRGVPLCEALGGRISKVACGEDFGVEDSIDTLLADVECAARRGFKRIKLKVKRGWDVEVLAAVRAAFPRIVIHVDCNGGYDLVEDWGVLKAFDRFELAMIEQPLSDTDIVEHARLQKRIGTPICLDESVKSPREFRIALEIEACRAINVKPGRVGGLKNAIEIHDMAREAGIIAWVGSMLESSVGVSICASLATLPGFSYPADIFPSSKFYAQELGGVDIALDERCCVDVVGLWPAAFRPKLKLLDEVTIARTFVTPPGNSFSCVI